MALPHTENPADISVIVGADAAGQRADRFLADVIGTLSRSRVKALIEAGRVQRDDTRFTEPADLVRAGHRFTIALPPLVDAMPQPQPMHLAILFEDDHLIVLDKPPGLVVHPAPGNYDGTLVNALLAHCGDTLPGIGGERRPGIVHRLDKDTSGVMVVAKTEAALASLSADFATREIDRIYLALAWGMPMPPADEIDLPIGRDPRDRKRMAVVPKGKNARTAYRTLQVWHAAASLLECRLATGRTHQIRVHLAQRGHPIVGDPVYLRRVPASARSLAPALRATLLDFPRQALHAARLGFRHPHSGEALLFETPPPPDMQTLLRRLETE